MAVNRAPRCMATNNRDGLQCSRRVVDGSSLCHIHQRRTNSPLIPPPDDPDPIAILKKLARDTDPKVRLRAVDLLLEIDKGKAKPADPIRESYDAFADALTDEERERLTALIQQVQAIREQVWTRRPDLPRPAYLLKPVTPEPREPEPERSIPPAVTPEPVSAAVLIDGVLYEDGVAE